MARRKHSALVERGVGNLFQVVNLDSFLTTPHEHLEGFAPINWHGLKTGMLWPTEAKAAGAARHVIEKFIRERPGIKPPTFGIFRLIAIAEQKPVAAEPPVIYTKV